MLDREALDDCGDACGKDMDTGSGSKCPGPPYPDPAADTMGGLFLRFTGGGAAE